MRTVLKYGVGLLTLTVACAGALTIVRGQEQEESPEGAPRKIDLPDPLKKDAIVIEKCRIKLIDSVVLSASRSGVLEFVEPREGDEIAANSLVAGLIDDVAQASYEAARIQSENNIEVRFAEKAYELADLEWKKAMQANANTAGGNVFPEIEIKRLKLAADKALLQIEQAEHQLEVDRYKRDEAFEVLKTYKIMAPFDGVVTKVYKSKGEGVRDGETLLEMVSTKRVKVEGYHHIKDMWDVKQGTHVQVKLDIPGAELEVENVVFEGRIQFVDVKVAPVKGDVRVWAEVSNKANILRDGLTATMTIFPGKLAAPPAASKPGVTQNKVKRSTAKQGSSQAASKVTQ